MVSRQNQKYSEDLFSLQKLPVSNKNIDKVNNSNKQMSREVLKVQFIPRRVVQNRPFNIIIIISIIIREPFKFFFLSVPSLIIALSCKSLRQFPCWILFKLLVLSKLLHVFLFVVKCICQNWYMYISELLHGFVKIDTWISVSCYMDLLNFFLALCQTKPSSSLTKISELVEAFTLK